MRAVARPVANGDAPELAYHRLRVALNRFGREIVSLDASQREAVEREARQQHAIECRVLATREAHDVVLPDDRLERALETVRSRYADPAAFQADLERNGLTREVLYVALRRELTAEAVLAKVGARAAPVDDSEVDLYYYLHPESFQRPETRTLRHILITINESFPENRPAEARARIQRIAARVRRRPIRFSEQALKHSECPTAMREGLLGRLPRGRLYPTLDAVAFDLVQGEVSPVVESPIGLHLLLCEQIHSAGPVPLGQARPRIAAHLQARRRQLFIRDWLVALADIPSGN